MSINSWAMIDLYLGGAGGGAWWQTRGKIDMGISP